MDGVPHHATHFHILKSHHLMAMGINVQISLDLKFFCWSHTKICKPHLLTKRPNFFTRKKLDARQIESSPSVQSFFFLRHATRIVFAQTFGKMYCGQQSWLHLVIPPPMIPQAYFFMENSTKGPLTQGKSPHQRDLQGKWRIQDANANIIEAKGVGINTFTGIGVSTNTICYRDTKLVK